MGIFGTIVAFMTYGLVSLSLDAREAWTPFEIIGFVCALILMLIIWVVFAVGCIREARVLYDFWHRDDKLRNDEKP